VRACFGTDFEEAAWPPHQEDHASSLVTGRMSVRTAVRGRLSEIRVLPWGGGSTRPGREDGDLATALKDTKRHHFLSAMRYHFGS
jgi:hypothetical protein